MSRSGGVDEKTNIAVVRHLTDPFEHRRVGQVKAQRPNLHSGSGTDIGRDLAQRPRLSRNKHEVETALGQLLSQAGTYPFRAPRDGRPRPVARNIDHASPSTDPAEAS